jgi:hypothetical protein
MDLPSVSLSPPFYSCATCHSVQVDSFTSWGSSSSSLPSPSLPSFVVWAGAPLWFTLAVLLSHLTTLPYMYRVPDTGTPCDSQSLWAWLVASEPILVTGFRVCSRPSASFRKQRCLKPSVTCHRMWPRQCLSRAQWMNTRKISLYFFTKNINFLFT